MKIEIYKNKKHTILILLSSALVFLIAAFGLSNIEGRSPWEFGFIYILFLSIPPIFYSVWECFYTKPQIIITEKNIEDTTTFKEPIKWENIIDVHAWDFYLITFITIFYRDKKKIKIRNSIFREMIIRNIYLWRDSAGTDLSHVKRKARLNSQKTIMIFPFTQHKLHCTPKFPEAEITNLLASLISEEAKEETMHKLNLFLKEKTNAIIKTQTIA